MMRIGQLELALTAPVRWGGWRNGAGRKASPRPRVWHRARAEFGGRQPGIVTLRVRRSVPSLRTLRFVGELERTLRAIARRRDFRVAHFSVQHDHVHLLVEAEGAVALSNGMKSLAARIARAANRAYDRRGAVLDGRYHHRALATPREVRAALAYVLNNARHHVAAHAGRPLASETETMEIRIDPASSGRWFEGWAGNAPVTCDPPAVAPAQTWLLRTGWRRHGLIRMDEIPGRARERRRAKAG